MLRLQKKEGAGAQQHRDVRTKNHAAIKREDWNDRAVRPVRTVHCLIDDGARDAVAPRVDVLPSTHARAAALRAG